jgi:DNA-binding transcriptional regulator YhcF (GntR family)
MAQSSRQATDAKVPQGGAALSPFRVDHDDEIPVGVQLDWRLRSLIASGRLAPGDRLPSVRELADWAGVNINTVRSVYGGLENRGIVSSQHGSGTFVAAEGFSAELERIAASAIAEARQLGASARELAMIAFVCSDVADEAELPELDPNTDDRAARDELRRQIARLEAQLASHVRDLPSDGPGSRAVGRVVGTRELEQTRDQLLTLLQTSRRAAERRGNREQRAKRVREEMVVDPSSHRWESVSDAEMGEGGCRDYSVTAGPLGSLMSWWRLKVSGGCPLAGSA